MTLSGPCPEPHQDEREQAEDRAGRRGEPAHGKAADEERRGLVPGRQPIANRASVDRGGDQVFVIGPRQFVKRRRDVQAPDGLVERVARRCAGTCSPGIS